MEINTNRRDLLIGLAATTTAAIPSVAIAQSNSADADPKKNPELVQAWRDFRSAEKEHYAANDDLSWLADEWKHLWPLAPEEILSFPNADGLFAGNKGVETDITGRPLKRDVTVLTVRLSKKFREKGGTTCFKLDQPEELSEWLAVAYATPITGKTPKAVERKRRQKNKTIAKWENKLRLATEYYAETTRLRELSGVAGVKARITAAEKRLTDTATIVSKLPATSLLGVRLKADAMMGIYEYYRVSMNNSSFLGDGMRLAESVLEATMHLDGAVKKSGAPS